MEGVGRCGREYDGAGVYNPVLSPVRRTYRNDAFKHPDRFELLGALFSPKPSKTGVKAPCPNKPAENAPVSQ